MNAKGKSVDTTFLSIDMAEKRGFLHRDYIAHCLRWSHVIKKLSEKKHYETARILDIGCGRELPLAKTLYSSRLAPAAYYGVDAGPILDSALQVFHTNPFKLKAWEHTDLLKLNLEDLDGQQVNWITCFEVLEHVEPVHMLKLLSHAKSLLVPGGTAFFSTPCWDVVSCADNHVNEMKYAALGAIFEAHGWEIREVSGTFASIRDYAHMMNPAHKETFDDLRAYYDVNLLSVIFAPFYPAYSRNCLWELTPVDNRSQRALKFDPIMTVPQPWGSSASWQSMALPIEAINWAPESQQDLIQDLFKPKES
jgi:2-polyprenyl-3-methyl-5-hydroxy-6-metoxy-1,4-benzoquinol methylase